MKRYISEEAFNVQRYHVVLVSVVYSRNLAGEFRGVQNRVLVGSQTGKDRDKIFGNFITGQVVGSKDRSIREILTEIRFVDFRKAIEDARARTSNVQTVIGGLSDAVGL